VGSGREFFLLVLYVKEVSNRFKDRQNVLESLIVIIVKVLDILTNFLKKLHQLSMFSILESGANFVEATIFQLP
jgi:hypothetical protein